ncbi:MAG: helix-turn-helix domain-containing protein [Bacteroidota bacterium]
MVEISDIKGAEPTSCRLSNDNLARFKTCSAPLIMSEEEILAAYLKKIRKDKDVTQEELSEATGISVRTIRSIENSKPVKKSSVDIIFKYLGYKVVRNIEIIKNQT